MGPGAVIRAAIGGFVLFLLLGLDLVLLGVIRLDHIAVTLMPLVGLAFGAALVGVADRRPASVPATAGRPGQPVPIVTPTAPTPPPVPSFPAVSGFLATHRAPDLGMDAWTTDTPGAPPDAHLDPALPVLLVTVEGDWARIRCANGWEAWVDARLLVPL